MVSKKTIFLIFIGLIGVSFLGYKILTRQKELPYDSAGVERGNIVQKVSVTGQVIPSQEIDLQFETQGKIEEVRVAVGEGVELGAVLVVLDSNDLATQVLEAEAAWDVAKASLDKTLAGASEEEIKVYETAVENAQLDLANAQKTAEEDLESAYEDALNYLEDSYLKIYNAFNFVDLLQRRYFNTSEPRALTVREKKDLIDREKDGVQSYLESAKIGSNEDTDIALSETKDSLEEIYSALSLIREICEESTYQTTVSTTDKDSLDSHKSYINTALTDIVDSQQTISSTRLTNDSNIDTAQGVLKTAEDNLAKIKAPARQADVNLSQAKLEEAEAALLKARQQLAKTRLIAPVSGIITDVKKEKGESVTTQEVVVSMMGSEEFQIEVDIPETDIGKLNILNPAEVILDAFPDEVYSGKVVKIDPAESIIQGVVYYKVTMELDASNEKIKPGMTANVDIVTKVRENVLIIPQRAVLTKNGNKMVRLLEGEGYKEVIIEVGIRDAGGSIEVVSGLDEGDEIITFMKEK